MRLQSAIETSSRQREAHQPVEWHVSVMYTGQRTAACIETSFLHCFSPQATKLRSKSCLFRMRSRWWWSLPKNKTVSWKKALFLHQNLSRVSRDLCSLFILLTWNQTLQTIRKTAVNTKILFLRKIFHDFCARKSRIPLKSVLQRAIGGIFRQSLTLLWHLRFPFWEPHAKFHK